MYSNYVFDLYGTLIDINTDEWDMKLWEKLALLYSYKGAEYTAEEINREYGRLVEEEKSKAKKRHPKYSAIDIKIEKVFRGLFTQKGVKANAKEVQAICTAFRCYSTKYIKLYDGVIDFLDALKKKRKRIYLLSNAQRKFTENELNMFNLTDYFDGIIISSDEECSKPDVEFYNILIERYNLDRSKTIMVGNDYLADIKGAKDAGLDALYIHQSISPKIKGKLLADYKIMNGDFRRVKKMILK